MAEGWNEKAIFLAALRLPVEEREAFLSRECPDEATRKSVEELLRHHSDDTLTISSGAAVGETAAPEMIDEFKIIRKIGEGGMGVVYLAHDTGELDRDVALKVLAPNLTASEQALARFRNEARITAALRHPAIVTVYKFGFDGTRHYLASEFVQGKTLAGRIQAEHERRKVDTDGAAIKQWQTFIAQTIAKVADGLDAAHQVSVVHRDVKPSNILIDDEDNEPRLTDFGIAIYAGPDPRTRTTDVLGSAHYMSPEQASIARTAIDGRSDIFSLGVVLYESLSLQRPFIGDTVPQILQALLSTDPPRLARLNPLIPRDLETICAKALQKEPSQRYQLAAQLSNDLRCFLADRPILARPEGSLRRARHWVRRHRRLVALTAFCILFVALAVAARRINTLQGEQLSWVNVTAPDGCQVEVARLDQRSMTLQALKDQSNLRDRADLRLPAGRYRFTVFRDTDSAFAEIDLDLHNPGAAHARHVSVVDGQQLLPNLYDDGHVVAVLRSSSDAASTGMLRIEDGQYALKGPAPGQEFLAAPIPIAAFLIDAQQVSNGEYQEFITATGRPPPRMWSIARPFERIQKLPVTSITLEEAEQYARWRGKRIATVLEWQAATRGTGGRLYPNGDQPPQIADVGYPSVSQVAANYAKSYLERVTPTDEPAPWDTRGGLLHTFSDVREFTSSVRIDAMQVFYVGRSWMNRPDNMTLASIYSGPLAEPGPDVGFRCAKSIINKKGKQ